MPDLFAFQSNFWVNFYHFLYVTARARAGLDRDRATVATALTDTSGFGKISTPDRNASESAVAYHDSTLAKRDILFDSGTVTPQSFPDSGE